MSSHNRHTHHTNGEQFSAMGYASQQPQPQQQYQYQNHPNSGYPGFVSTAQQSSQGPPQQGLSALRILADVALAGGGIPEFRTRSVQNSQQPTEYVQSGGGMGVNAHTNMSMNTNTNRAPPVSYSTGPPFVPRPPHPPYPVHHFTPSATGEYTQYRPPANPRVNPCVNPRAVPGNAYPSNAYPLTTSTGVRTASVQQWANHPHYPHPPRHPRHPSYNQLPSTFETAANLRSFALSGSSSHTMPGSNSHTSSSPAAAPGPTKKKSSYIVDQMERLDKVEKDRVGHIRDKTKHFALSSVQETDAADATSTGDSAEGGKQDDKDKDKDKDKGKKKFAAKQESTRDRPGEKYVRMFEEPEQKRYEEAMLEVLDGMELPRPFGK